MLMFASGRRCHGSLKCPCRQRQRFASDRTKRCCFRRQDRRRINRALDSRNHKVFSKIQWDGSCEKNTGGRFLNTGGIQGDGSCVSSFNTGGRFLCIFFHVSKSPASQTRKQNVRPLASPLLPRKQNVRPLASRPLASRPSLASLASFII